MDEFNYHTFKWTCSCGTKAIALSEVGITSLGEMCVLWYCHTCRQPVMARIPLEKMIADIPAHPGGLPQRKQLPPATGLTEEDKKFLRDFHIKDEEPNGTES